MERHLWEQKMEGVVKKGPPGGEHGTQPREARARGLHEDCLPLRGSEAASIWQLPQKASTEQNRIQGARDEQCSAEEMNRRNLKLPVRGLMVTSF